MLGNRNGKTGSPKIIATEMLKKILLLNKLTAERAPPQPADTMTWISQLTVVCHDRPPKVACRLASKKEEVNKLLPGSNLEGKVENKIGK